ncbi:alpha/beta fold hydrolase [Bacillus horti]|uniref:Pimeloyl-ACP methyl ester carboxylesterase n=1 Tax=Caldalkalibacillus horti TaxID=77523 RepID=A0ABT9VZT2_9BACI|nr:alpha/beta hydrolase [Bacillus horti]MDQ0166507.1 pimeloyl-ACP methyl ester carboxylesterase [Bacillus horti]
MSKTTTKMTTKTLEVQGFKTHCYMAGESGPEILLIHGAGVDSAMLSWSEVIEPLAENYQVYAPDFPGYGQSEYKQGIEYSNTFYTKFTHDLIKELNLNNPIIIGISMGGGIAIEYAITYPDQLQVLGLVNSNGILDKWQWHYFTYHFYVNTPLNALSYKMMAKSRKMTEQIVLSGLFYNPENVTEKLLDDCQKAAQSPHAGKAFGSLQKSEYLGRQGLKSDFSSRMPQIKAPTFIVHGTEDRTVPVAHAHKAHQLIPNSELFLIEEARHWPQKEKPEDFIRITREFLAQQDL